MNNNKTLEHHIHLIYETVNNPASWSNCLENIAKTIDASFGIISFENNAEKLLIPESERVIHANTHDTNRPTTNIEQNINKSLLLANNLKACKNSCHDSFSFENHIGHILNAYIGQSSDNLVRISFERCKNKEVYSDIHIIYLNRLLPHFKHALALCRKVLEGNVENELSQKLLDSTQSIIFIIDSNSNIIKKSSNADKLLADEILLKTFNEKITWINGIDSKDFFSIIERVTCPSQLFEKTQYVPFLIPKKQNNGFWLFEISRFESTLDPATAKVLSIDTNIYAMITIRDLFHTNKSISNRLNTLYSLSDSESDISLMVSKGMTPKEIAKARNRSIETIRTQIKQICIKLGVKNTNSLIAHINHLKD